MDHGCRVGDLSGATPRKDVPMLRLLPLMFLVACATESFDDDVIDNDGKADSAARPAGVYSRREATDGQLMELMLLPDRTFLRFEATGDWRERGSYQFTKSTTSTKRYIRFLDDEGTLIDRYTYTMSGSAVRLQRDGATYPMFSVATGEAAWVEAVKTDWFDEQFEDWGAETFPRTGLKPAELPASVRSVYDEVLTSLGPNEFPSIYRFDLHGRRGFELDGDGVRLFDATGAQVAKGEGESMFDFAWE